MATKNEIIRIDETTEMLFKDKKAKKVWDECVETYSKDMYSRFCITYARRWAKYMQILIVEGKAVAEIAERTSPVAQ